MNEPRLKFFPGDLISIWWRCGLIKKGQGFETLSSAFHNFGSKGLFDTGIAASRIFMTNAVGMANTIILKRPIAPGVPSGPLPTVARQSPKLEKRELERRNNEERGRGIAKTRALLSSLT